MKIDIDQALEIWLENMDNQEKYEMLEKSIGSEMMEYELNKLAEKYYEMPGQSLKDFDGFCERLGEPEVVDLEDHLFRQGRAALGRPK